MSHRHRELAVIFRERTIVAPWLRLPKQAVRKQKGASLSARPRLPHAFDDQNLMRAPIE